MSAFGYSKEYDMFVLSYEEYLDLIEKSNCEYDIDDQFENIIYQICKPQTEEQEKERKFTVDPIKYYDYLDRLCVNNKLTGIERAYALYYLSYWGNLTYILDFWSLKAAISFNLDNEFEDIPK